ncbi:MAG TPA: hypothetical protein VF006_13700 [Longimicrobium sp.]
MIKNSPTLTINFTPLGECPGQEREPDLVVGGDVEAASAAPGSR